MYFYRMKKVMLILLFISLSFQVFSQEKKPLKTQYSNFLSKSYYAINFGGIFYPFTNDNLIDNYKTDSYSKNYFSGRFLLGHKITPNLGVQFGVMRPADWFKYDNINNIGYFRSVWINVWSLSLKKSFTINDKFSFFAEAGIANVTRNGFSINDVIVYPDAHFASFLYGFGLNYKLNEKWKLAVNSTFLPKSSKHNQPAISQVAVGFEYHLQQIPEKIAIERANNRHFFPDNIFQVSYGTSEIGFGVNRFFAMSLKIGNFESFGVPVFWVGESRAAHSFSVTYQKLAYRSEKIFSLDWGVSVTAFQSEAEKENVFAFSIFPTMRFYLLRKPRFDMYTFYSLIGPTYLTKNDIDGLGTGPKITYQDTMGLGFFFGEARKYNFEMRIMHYSNGNIFNKNSGVAIPLQFTFGKTF